MIRELREPVFLAGWLAVRGELIQEAIGGSFISNIVYLALGLGISQDTMNISSLAFALLVLATFALAPPRRPDTYPTTRKSAVADA